MRSIASGRPRTTRLWTAGSSRKRYAMGRAKAPRNHDRNDAQEVFTMDRQEMLDTIKAIAIFILMVLAMGVAGAVDRGLI